MIILSVLNNLKQHKAKISLKLRKLNNPINNNKEDLSVLSCFFRGKLIAPQKYLDILMN